MGGGIYVKGEGGNPILRGNNILGNSANSGGGIYTEHNATIENCTIEDNDATVTAGGGVHLSGKGDLVRRCRILRNTAPSNGAGVFLPNGTATIDGCLIAGNISAAYGGGFGCKDDSNPVILHSIIANNTSQYIGGGIYLYNSASSSITNSLIVRNRSTQERGGGIGVEAGIDVSLRNCVVADNTGPSNVPGGGAYFSSNTALVTNSIFWGNQSGNGTQIGVAGTTVTIRYSDIEDRNDGGVSAFNMNTVHFGDGCIGEILPPAPGHHDPLFVDPDGPDNDPNTWDDNDYRVTPGIAPGNDAGNNDDIPTDVTDMDHDGNSGERAPFDLKGTVRRADDPVATATGAPANDFPWVDFGAYEQCGVVTPVAGGGAPNYRNRAIPLALNDSEEIAIRVRLVSLQHPDPANPPASPPPTFTSFEGQSRWVGEPARFFESQDNPGLGIVRIARLQCTPYYRNWSQVGEDNLGSADPVDDEFFVVGAEIVPSSTYRVETYLKSSCYGEEDTCAEISCAVEFTTARWGDVVAPFNPPESSTQPDSLDVVAMLDKFRNQPNTPSGSVAHLQPNLPMFVQAVGAMDIVATVDAFRGLAYPFSGPCACPSEVNCGATACTSAGDCAGGLCVRTCNAGPNAGDWCKDNSHCPDSACGAGFCRDRCGRCN